MYQSVHARGGIHTTTTLSLRVSSIQNLAYRIRKGYVVSYVTSTRQQPRGHPDKAPASPRVRCQPRAQGAFSSPERSPTGQPVA
jgi:hypothetical protein